MICVEKLISFDKPTNSVSLHTERKMFIYFNLLISYKPILIRLPFQQVFDATSHAPKQLVTTKIGYSTVRYFL